MKQIFFPTKDASITNSFADLGTSRKVYSNMGGSDVLETFVLYNRDGSLEYELSRFLIQFNISELEKRAGSYAKLAESKVFLCLYNTPHSKTLPKEFSLEIYRLTHSWEEGIGLDMEQYTDEGGVCWRAYETVPKGNPRPTIYNWVTEGGDFDVSSKKVVYFHEGDEDCRVDITDWVLQWADPQNPYPNNGILVKFPDAEETIKQKNYYTKKFFARKSQFFYKRPRLELLSRDVSYVNLNYDRLHFTLDSYITPSLKTNYLFYFNYSPLGVYVDIPGFENNSSQLYVRIKNSKGELIRDGIRPLRVSNGIYKYSLNLDESEVNGEKVVFDEWYTYETDEKPFFVGKITFLLTEKNFYFSSPEVVIPKLYIKNIKPVYTTEEVITFSVFAYDLNWSPNVWVSYYRDGRRNGLKLKNTYYKIVRKIDETVIVDYSFRDEEANIDYSKVFYNDEINYFTIHFSIFEPGFMYEIRFMSILEDNSLYEHQETFKFRVDEKRSFRF
ncbi:MAG: hypothetical protein N3A54_03470 [Patescibacteria group bacterium]|nr:hypothetical protein [Patescibacteria group bacterium]